MLGYHHVIKEIRIDSIEELLRSFSPFGSCKDLLDGFIFRGESSAKYSLSPSALRKESQDKLWRMAMMGTMYSSPDNLNQREWEVRQMAAEYCALRGFFIRADNCGLELPSVDRLREKLFTKENRLQYDFNSNDQEWIPRDLLELAGLAQHYGIPTRLLDWSHSHLIALYFAAIGAIKNDSPNDSDSIVLWALNAE